MKEDINNERKIKVLEFIQDENYSPMKLKEIASLLQIPKKEGKELNNIINSLESEGKIFITKKGKITTPEDAQIIVGTFLGTARSFGFVSPDDPDIEDIFIPPSNINGAMHKDRVFCKVIISARNSKKSEGNIIKILERGYNHIVGTFISRSKNSIVIPDNKKLAERIIIPNGMTKGAVTGHKVLVVLRDKVQTDKFEGKVIEILGHKNDPGVDILSIVSQFEIPRVFPEDVLKEIEDTPVDIVDEDLSKRRDLRNKIVITIDGADTKDIDDAISLEKLHDGNYKLGVYIADVTHYVKHNSPLDVEALKRGTSVYLIDRVIPMLPHKLSNGICSLDEGLDRLCLSCEMIIDNYGNIISHEIFEGVLNVSKRTTYTIVEDILINENSSYLEEYKDYLNMINLMKELQVVLKKKREERGAIEFDFPEAQIIVDEDGNPTDVLIRERNIATGIIEEFMLITNETIAEQFFWLESPFIYRTHEEPDEEKLRSLVEFIKNFGYSIKPGNAHPKNLQGLLNEVEGTKHIDIISRVMLRSLKQARYTDANYGHFGLAAKYYCHFTSPIRRYPDLQIHRIIKEYLNLKLDDKKRNYYNSNLSAVANQCSKAERKAEEAEREVDKLKKVQFMENKVGEIFEGMISSVTSWGIYITLPNTIEGMVFTETLPKDTYIFDEKKMQYVGHRKKRVFALGDKVRVELIGAKVEEREIDFIIVDEDEKEQHQ